MDIATDKVCDLILRAREIDGKEGITDPDSGSNPIDDGSTDVLTASTGAGTEDQIREFLAGLNDDERHDLVAITWIGRGDYEAAEWAEARRTARERETLPTADYLLGLPNLGDLLEEGLSALGRRCD